MRLNVEFRDELYRELELFAKQEDQTISAVIRSLVHAWLKEQRAANGAVPAMLNEKEADGGRAEQKQ